MTVSYQYDVASSTSGGFTRLLFKWEGSLYKLIYKEFFLFCVAYAVMSAFYRYTFTENMKRTFEQVAFYCDTYMNYIPLSFILGFYVSFVASRWWQQYMAIPWPDKLLHVIALYVHGNDERARIIRRSMVRYLNLSLVLVLRSISSAVKKRFPTLEHLVEAGFITSQELQTFNLVPNKEFNTYWVPCTWFTAIIREARHQKRFTDPSGIKIIMEEFSEFRQKCGMLWSYDWVSIPLVYTQVVTIATYSFFIAAIVGRQFLDKSPIPYKKMIDIYVPFFTVLQFFFYMGLLKVAEQLINPFGDDDEDFELNWIIDRHMKVSYLIVDTLINRIPPLTKDIFFDVESVELPYTEASASFKKKTYRGSVANMVVPEEKQHLILPDIIEEGDEDDQGDDGKQSIFKSSLPSFRASVNFLNNSETYSNPTSNIYLTVPDEGQTNSDNKPSANRSNPPSRNHSKRSGTAGSKGINSALMFAGCHQGLYGSDTTSLGEPISIDGLQEGLLDDLQKLKPVRAGDELDYLIMPFKDVCLNIDDSIMESSESRDKVKSKNVFSSLQAKIAMRRKPVIKWKPYVRPDHIRSQISLEYDQFSRENLLPPGVFEDECAFMWRTIEDEVESLKAPSFTALNDELDATPIPSEYRKELLSQYSKVKPKSVSRDSTIDHDAFDDKLKKSKKLMYSDTKYLKTKRHRFKLKGRTRYTAKSQAYKSLQHIPSSSCRQEEFISKFLRCLSESSVFIDVIGTHMKFFQTITSQKPEFSSRRRASAPLPTLSVIPANLLSPTAENEATELQEMSWCSKPESANPSKNVSEYYKKDIPFKEHNFDNKTKNLVVTHLNSSREASLNSSKNSIYEEPENFISRENR